MTEPRAKNVRFLGLSLDLQSREIIQELADKEFEGNRSMAARRIIREWKYDGDGKKR